MIESKTLISYSNCHLFMYSLKLVPVRFSNYGTCNRLSRCFNLRNQHRLCKARISFPTHQLVNFELILIDRWIIK